MAVRKALVNASGRLQVLQSADSLVHHGIRNLGGSTLTLATDAITRTSSYHKVDTQAAAATDNLSTISGGASGDILIVSPANDARTIVVKDGVDNITTGSGDLSLDSDKDVIVLMLFGTGWLVLGFQNNAA